MTATNTVFPTRLNVKGCSIELNVYRMYIDEHGKLFGYNLCQLYTDGSFHLNVYDAESLEEAQKVAADMAADLDITISSINEGMYFLHYQNATEKL